MRTKLTKITLAATLGFALTLTLSCSDGGGNNGEAPSTGEQSETKITKSKITGVSQKGPFVEGSTATLDELDDEFTQTGRSFRDIIADDKGSFEIRGVELISPYARLEAYGYYRNEVTGEVSKGPITLIAIADIREKDNVNVNLLTHLEYYRVLNLVEGGKSVAEAKKQAQKEILAVFGIDGNFENSEDMTIFGATEGDAALLAISVLLQGNLGEGEFSQRLTNFAQSLKESGKWENEAAKAAIADWASTANLAVIRSNITGWGLSSEVPDFEKYVTDYWTVAYSLGGCGSANSGEVKKDNRNAYRICKTGNWAVASELEYDTYQWVCLDANEGEIKAGNVSGKDYICKNKGWMLATEFERDTYKWVCSDANEGEIKAGNVSGKDYICKNKGWVTATEFERDIYQWSCSDVNEGEIKAGNVSSKDYVCENNAWRAATSVETDIQSVCLASIEGEIKAGKVSNIEYVCKYGIWQEPNYKDKYCFEKGCEYFVDTRDNQRYAYVLIGEQTWMAEDLNYKAPGDYKDTLQSKRIYNCESTSLCPAGWHLPSIDDLQKLSDFVIFDNNNNITCKVDGSGIFDFSTYDRFCSTVKYLKATSHWNIWYNGIANTDDYGFSALPVEENDSVQDWCGVNSRFRLNAVYFYASEAADYDSDKYRPVRCLKD